MITEMKGLRRRLEDLERRINAVSYAISGGVGGGASTLQEAYDGGDGIAAVAAV